MLELTWLLGTLRVLLRVLKGYWESSTYSGFLALWEHQGCKHGFSRPVQGVKGLSNVHQEKDEYCEDHICEDASLLQRPLAFRIWHVTWACLSSKLAEFWWRAYEGSEGPMSLENTTEVTAAVANSQFS